jgi:hypothetical protein
VRLKGVGKLQKYFNYFINRTRDLPSCCTVPQTNLDTACPQRIFLHLQTLKSIQRNVASVRLWDHLRKYLYVDTTWTHLEAQWTASQRCVSLSNTRTDSVAWGQSYWLQIQRSGFNSRRYQIFWEVVVWDVVKVKVKVKVILRPTVSQPVRLGTRHPPGTRDQFFSFSIFFLTVSGLLMWSALSDEKSGLYFSVFAGHRQRSLSQIWVPWDSWA